MGSSARRDVPILLLHEKRGYCHDRTRFRANTRAALTNYGVSEELYSNTLDEINSLWKKIVYDPVYFQQTFAQGLVVISLAGMLITLLLLPVDGFNEKVTYSAGISFTLILVAMGVAPRVFTERKADAANRIQRELLSEAIGGTRWEIAVEHTTIVAQTGATVGNKYAVAIYEENSTV